MWRLVNRNVHSLRYCYALIVDTSDLGACRNVNCANGGTCSAGNCTCVEGYKGDRCTELDSELLCIQHHYCG